MIGLAAGTMMRCSDFFFSTKPTRELLKDAMEFMTRAKWWFDHEVEEK
jgi:hypothetical protein